MPTLFLMLPRFFLHLVLFFFFVSAREIRYTDLHNSFMISFSLCQMKKIKTSICEVLNEGVDQDDSSKIVVLDFLTNVASHQV